MLWGVEYRMGENCPAQIREKEALGTPAEESRPSEESQTKHNEANEVDAV